MLEETGGNYPAPAAVLRAVKAGVEQGPEAGYAAELAEFATLVVSPEAKALIGVFFDSQALKTTAGVVRRRHAPPGGQGRGDRWRVDGRRHRRGEHAARPGCAPG